MNWKIGASEEVITGRCRLRAAVPLGTVVHK